MSRSRRPPRRAVVEHDARLDILCCLDPDESMAIAQVSTRTGIHPTLTKHHINILDAFSLVGKKEEEGGQAFYVARLDEQPDWVREAVETHRSAERRDGN